MGTVRFGLLQSVDQLPFFVMQEKGFAKEQGLRLTEKVVLGGAAVIEEIAKGTIDAGYPGSVPVINAAHAGVVPRSAVSVGASAFGDAAHRVGAVLVARGIENWRDLRGRRIAVNQPGSIGDLALRSRMAAEGAGSPRLVSIPFPNQGLAVAGGNVAAAVMFEPFITQSVLRGDGRILDWVVGGGQPFPEFEEIEIAFATAFTREHPERVRAFLRAHLQAVRWIAAHESEARVILTRRLGLTEEIGRKMDLPRFSTDGRNDPRLLAEIEQALLRVTPGLSPVAVGDIYDASFLDQFEGGP